MDYARIDYHVLSTEGDHKAVQAPGSRSIQPLAIDVVVRTMAGALETHAVITEWYGAAQVDTTLVQRDPERTILMRSVPCNENCVSFAR